MSAAVADLLGAEAKALLDHRCQTIPRESLHLPGADFMDRVWVDSDRSSRVLANLNRIARHGRLAGTGYVSILPVDQGGLRWRQVHELSELGSGAVQGRHDDTDITLFESQGVALEDIATGIRIVQMARERGIGREVSF